MKQTFKSKSGETLTILSLTKELVHEFAQTLIAIADLIPEVEPHTLEELLQETKGDRILYAKWSHSYIVLDDKDIPVGLLIGYERAAEHNDQYPQNTIYLNVIAVDKKYQNEGIGSKLVEAFLDEGRKFGLISELKGPVNFTVQTTSADWNRPVQAFYQRCGFKAETTKTYDNRVDLVMRQ